MIQPTPKPRRIWDDIVRSVIFLFGMTMAAVFLFAWPNSIVGLGFAMLFLIAGGRNMRVAFFPYGKLVESLFWVAVSGIGFIVLLILWVGGSEIGTGAVLVGALLGYSIYDTYRSIRVIHHVLTAREQAEREKTEHDRPNDEAGPTE